METLMERAKKLQEQGVFLGGARLPLFEKAGRMQLITLLYEGLNPQSKVLDIGCGCLCGGYWLIHFLDPECYCGIEPNPKSLDAGVQTILEPGLMELKKPRFDRNAEFDVSMFDTSFDYFFARSIWTHASKNQIEKMLDGFAEYSTENGAFLTTYKRPNLLRRDYKGEDWIGAEPDGKKRGFVRHSFGWIQQACIKRRLNVEEVEAKSYTYGGQIWLRIKHLQF